MDRVYLLTYDHPDGLIVVGVFRTEELAEQKAEELTSDNYPYQVRSNFIVEEVELDKVIDYHF